MSGNGELGRGLRRREKNANKAGAERIEKPAPDARAAPPEAHESLIGRKTVEEVPLTGLSSAITAWSFSVSGGAELPYTVSSSDSGARYSITGAGTYSIEATSAGLFIPSASSLTVGTGSPSFLDFVTWDHTANDYASARAGNTSPRGWATFDSTALNAAFGGGAMWQIAAVPEPSTYAMALAGIACGGYSMWRRRKRA